MSDLWFFLGAHVVVSIVLGAMWWDRRHDMDFGSWWCLGGIALITLGPLWMGVLFR